MCKINSLNTLRLSGVSRSLNALVLLGINVNVITGIKTFRGSFILLISCGNSKYPNRPKLTLSTCRLGCMLHIDQLRLNCTLSHPQNSGEGRHCSHLWGQSRSGVPVSLGGIKGARQGPECERKKKLSPRNIQRSESTSGVEENFFGAKYAQAYCLSKRSVCPYAAKVACLRRTYRPSPRLVGVCTCQILILAG